MKKILKTILFLLFCFQSIGQIHKIKMISENNIIIFSDLNTYLNDTSAIVYPYVTDQICESLLDIKHLSKEYGFTAEQFCYSSNDTFSLKANKYFNVIESDTVIQFHNVGFFEIEKGVVVLTPFLYFVKQKYKKKYVRYFSVPIISRNGKFAIVKYEDLCGEDCGSGAILVMEKIKNKWIVIDSLIEIMI
jgi:hypothetical protein